MDYRKNVERRVTVCHQDSSLNTTVFFKAPGSTEATAVVSSPPQSAVDRRNDQRNRAGAPQGRPGPPPKPSPLEADLASANEVIKSLKKQLRELEEFKTRSEIERLSLSLKVQDVDIKSSRLEKSLEVARDQIKNRMNLQEYRPYMAKISGQNKRLMELNKDTEMLSEKLSVQNQQLLELSKDNEMLSEKLADSHNLLISNKAEHMLDDKARSEQSTEMQRSQEAIIQQLKEENKILLDSCVKKEKKRRGLFSKRMDSKKSDSKKMQKKEKKEKENEEKAEMKKKVKEEKKETGFFSWIHRKM